MTVDKQFRATIQRFTSSTLQHLTTSTVKEQPSPLNTSTPQHFNTSTPQHPPPMPHLICYDISSNTLRSKIGRKIIESGLDRINKSVYLGSISDRSLTTLEQWLAQQIKDKSEPQDSLIIIPLHASQIQEMRVYGHNELDKEELSGEKSTLII